MKAPVMPVKLISVIIPVYNEVRTIEEVVRRVRAVDMPKELIVIDDCSSDGTRGLLEKLKELGQVEQVIFHERNCGKGAALRSGFAHARGDVLVVQDADLSTILSNTQYCWSPFLLGRPMWSTGLDSSPVFRTAFSIFGTMSAIGRSRFFRICLRT